MYKYNLDELENISDLDESAESDSQSDEKDDSDNSASVENNLVQLKKRVANSLWPLGKLQMKKWKFFF